MKTIIGSVLPFLTHGQTISYQNIKIHYGLKVRLILRGLIVSNNTMSSKSEKLCTVCKKNEAVHRLLCNDCLVVISRDMIDIRDKEPLEGTTEQQRYAQWTYDYDFGHLKDKFSE